MFGLKLFLLATLSLSCSLKPELTELVQPCQSTTIITIDPDTDLGECSITNNSTCRNLEDTLVKIAEQVSSNSPGQNASCVVIDLPPGDHVISSPLYMGPASVHLIGQGNDSTRISCSFAGSVPTERLVCGNETVTNHTWYFRGSEVVIFEGLGFTGCPLPVRLDAVRNVGIHNCTFRNFTEAVFDIFNAETVFITSSLFRDNRGTSISPCPYRGNTGAVAIGFNSVSESFSNPCVRVLDSYFINNRATAENAFRTSSGAFFTRVFSGRGGAIGVFIGAFEHNVTVEISDCFFDRNFARSFGGTLYLLMEGEQTRHSLMLNRNQFKNSIGLIGGGAVQLSFLSNGRADNPHTANFTECMFEGNRGDSGGGIYVFPSFLGEGNFAKFEGCVFRGNRGASTRNDYGAAIAFSGLSLFRQRQSLPQYEITDCWFEGNSGSDGIVSVGYAPVAFHGNNTFLNNFDTSALRIIGTLVDLNGNLRFINNTVTTAQAALHLLSFGQVRFHRGLYISFEGNSGRFGASILVETSTASITFGKLQFNPLCFALYEDSTALPSQWEDVTIAFRDNTAILASSLYILRLDTCSFVALKEPYFNRTAIVDWPVWDFGNDSRNTGYSDPYNISYSVQTAPKRITTTKDSVAAWPGQETQVELNGWDQFSHSTSLIGRFIFKPNATTLQGQAIVVGFEPQLVIVDDSNEGGLLDSAFTIHYSISDPVAIDESLPLGNIIIDVPINPLEAQPATLTLFHRRCPGGYILVEVPVDNFRLECECKVNTTKVIHCEDDQDTIVIENGYWAVYSPPPIDGIREDIDGNLVFHPCPSSYCRCTQNSTLAGAACVYTYTHSQPDAQCSCGRSGILCGECQGSVGKSALLSKCVDCHDASGLLIVGLVVLDVVVFISLVLFDLPLPAWTYPFLFYIQIAPYVSLYFSDSFETVGKFLYFFASGTSFYFIWDACLYGNMSALVSYTLRYIPLLIALLLSPLIILVRKKWRLLQHHGVWWVVLLLYSHTVHTSLSILDCPFLPTSVGTPPTPRWFVDGSVQCFAGGHVPLGLLAILVLLVCLTLIPVVALIALDIQHPKKPLWIRHFVAPLQQVFRAEVCWWAAVELARRLVFLLFLTAFPRNIAVSIFILCIYITVYGLVQPYKSSIVNFLEIGLQINFLLLLLLQQTETIQDDYFTFPTRSVVNESFSLSVNESLQEHSCPSEVQSTAKIVWILMPFYYFPVLVLIFVAIVFLVLFIRARYCDSYSPDETEPDADGTLSRHKYVSSDVFFQTVDLGPRTFTHGSVVVSNWKKLSTRLKRSRREPPLPAAVALRELHKSATIPEESSTGT